MHEDAYKKTWRCTMTAGTKINFMRQISDALQQSEELIVVSTTLIMIIEQACSVVQYSVVQMYMRVSCWQEVHSHQVIREGHQTQ